MTDQIQEELFGVLSGHLFHCTGLSQFYQIQSEGFIRPNVDGRAFTFPQTANSYGHSIGAISLFDLKDQTPEICHEGLFSRWSFHRRDSPVNVLLLLDRQLLANRLIPNTAARSLTPHKIHIPYVESWCKEPISISLITACAVRCCVGVGAFSVLEGKDRLLERVEQIVKEYQELYSDDFEKNAKENEFWDEVFNRLYE